MTAVSWLTTDCAPNSTSLMMPARKPAISKSHHSRQFISMLGMASLRKGPHSCRQSTDQPVVRDKDGRGRLREINLQKPTRILIRLSQTSVTYPTRTDNNEWKCVTSPAPAMTWNTTISVDIKYKVVFIEVCLQFVLQSWTAGHSKRVFFPPCYWLI